MVRLVLCDMDGTLVPTGSESVSEVALRAMHRLMNMGVRVGAASGRGVDDLRKLFRKDEACLRTAVASNGCVVRLDGRTLIERPLDRVDLKQVLEMVRRQPDTFLSVSWNERRMAIGESYEVVRAHYADWPGFDMEVCDELPEGPLVKVNVCLPRGEHSKAELERNQAFVEELRRSCKKTDFCLLGGHVADMTPTGVSKATGLVDLLEATGISRDEVLVFGDSENDESIMALVPGSVTVSNATARIIGIARFHIGSCEEDAVAHALDELATALENGAEPTWMRPAS